LRGGMEVGGAIRRCLCIRQGNERNLLLSHCPAIGFFARVVLVVQYGGEWAANGFDDAYHRLSPTSRDVAMSTREVLTLVHTDCIGKVEKKKLTSHHEVQYYLQSSPPFASTP